jgi:tRNA G18 (ribose-2'-O)-methylase SpoU
MLNAHLDEELAIPHFKLSENRAESLNVATAGAIFLSEIFRSGGSIQK